MTTRWVDLIDLALPLMGKQTLTHRTVEGVELLLARRCYRP